MVECASCGFLALRNTRERTWLECEDKYRISAQVAEWRWDDDRLDEDTFLPSCFAGVPDLAIDLYDALKKEPTAITTAWEESKWKRETMLGILNKGRYCSEFTPWIRGFSPKEHREMMDRDKMLRWQREESNANRRYRILELALVLATIGAVLWAAFIERGGQPTIIVNYPTPSVSDTEAPQP